MDKIESANLYRDTATITCTPESVRNTGVCFPYYKFEIRPGMATEKMTRNYSDWLNTLANIGGFTELIFIFFTWIYIFYHHCSQRSYLKEALFGGSNSSCNEAEDMERQGLIEEDLEQSSSLEDSIREIQGLRILN